MAGLLTKVGREFRRVAKRFRRRPTTAAEKLREWRSVHQPFELRFHQGENYRWNDEQFWGQWKEVFGSLMGLTTSSFNQGQVLLDVGCGSRPALDWFEGPAERHFLDPLLDQYRQIDAMRVHWQAKPTATLISQPAERLAEHLAGRCDFVNCWNVLDHTYDWRQILDNLRAYARTGALVCLGTDFQSHGDGHPGIDDRAWFDRFIEMHFEVVASRPNFTGREIAMQLIRR
jgi:hypothetical protein